MKKTSINLLVGLTKFFLPFVIGVLGDGLVMLGISEFWQKVIIGVVIVIAVIFDKLQGSIQSKKLLQEK